MNIRIWVILENSDKKLSGFSQKETIYRVIVCHTEGNSCRATRRIHSSVYTFPLSVPQSPFLDLVDAGQGSVPAARPRVGTRVRAGKKKYSGLKKYTDILVIWTRMKSCGPIFFIREKSCARIRSHIEALGSNTRDIGVLFLPAVLFLPVLTL